MKGVEQSKKWAQKPGNALSDALLMSRLENFAADAANSRDFFFKKKTSRGFNSLINLNQFGAKDSEKLFCSLLSNSAICSALSSFFV